MTQRTGPPSQCLYCFRRNSTEDGQRTCEAYPGGIPDAIWANTVDHRKPQPGDHGLRWKPDLGVDEFPEWAMAPTG